MDGNKRSAILRALDLQSARYEQQHHLAPCHRRGRYRHVHRNGKP